MTTNLVVADNSRTEKTICLAVTPSLKAYGLPGRARLFEVVQKVKEINYRRRWAAPKRQLVGEAFDAKELEANKSLALSYITATPRMACYSRYSTRIFDVYLKYFAREDILSYSIDEVFIDATNYLNPYKLTARELTRQVIRDIYSTTGITAAAGLGTNMYLAKVAMDITAKKIPADADGVRIAELDEHTYRRELWEHTPLTDFWRIGQGYSKKLEASCLTTMGDIARRSLSVEGEKHLFKLFGKNAELLIDHAWGREPCTMQDIKAYVPENKSIGSGQVLHCPYEFSKARIIVQEMLELLALDLVEKGLVTDQIVLTVGYDIDNLTNPKISSEYHGEITTDYYGRRVPKHAHGTANIGRHTSSAMLISQAALKLFDEIMDEKLLVRRVNISANHVIPEGQLSDEPIHEQYDFFTDYEEKERAKTKEAEKLQRERKIQEATIQIRKRYGKNALLKGMNLQEGATTIDRNQQIGGHKA